MAAQQNLLRTLTLLRLLKQRPGKTLAQLLNCSPRHVRRLMDTLEAVGYFVDHKKEHPLRFYIFENKASAR